MNTFIAQELGESERMVNKGTEVEFEVVTVVCTKMGVFWVITTRRYDPQTVIFRVQKSGRVEMQY
jgi:hypothetical protein